MGNHRPFFIAWRLSLLRPHQGHSLRAFLWGDNDMKKLLLLTALTALSACSQKTEESEETAAAPNEAVTPAPATDSGTQPGTYDVKMADGTMATTVINADGTYVDTSAKGEIVKGLYARKDGKDCFDPEGDALGGCWDITQPGADGSFTATSPEGTVVTVTPRKK
jgi:hypothetical protein